MSEREPARGQWRRSRAWFFVYAGTVAVVAVVAGIVWNRLVVLPTYQIGEDFRARIPESGLSQIAGTDVYFTLIGLVGGLVLGVTAWILFHNLGWPVTLIAGVGALVAGLLARYVGQFIGPRDFDERIAIATIGDFVRVDFTANSWVPMAVWVAMAVLPVFIGSLFMRDQWISHVPQTPGEEEHETDGDNEQP